MMKVEATIIGNKQLRAFLEKYPQAAQRAIKSGLIKGADELVDRIIQKLTGGNPLSVRSGRLRSSIRRIPSSNLLEEEINIGGKAGSNVAYAAIQEFGGTITPKNKQFLAIPLSAARTASGVQRGDPRSFGNTFVRKSKNGNLIIFQRRGIIIVPLFVLKRSVTIKEKPYARTSVNEMKDRIGEVVAAALRNIKIGSTT